MFYRRIILIYLILTLNNTVEASNNTLKYLSPGLRLGWEFGRGLSIGYKISFGINTNIDFNKYSQYYNITFGYKTSFFKGGENNPEKYSYFEFQYGCTPFVKNNVFLSGGVGIARLNNNNKVDYKPIASMDFGYLLYISFDVIFLKINKLDADLGILGILPIPLEQSSLNFD